MKLLWVATKSPWPARDGGRLLLAESLAALAAAGVRATLVAPAESGDDEAAAGLERICEPRLVATRLAGRVASGLRSVATGEPLALARHRWPALAREVAALAAERDFDLVVAEQLHALAATAPARGRGVPLLLRAQNVESDLWRGAADLARGLRAAALAREARRLAARESEALSDCAGIVALSSEDAAALGRLSGGRARVTAIPPPFPAQLPAGGAPLAGAPALVLFGSRGWLPNLDAERWCRDELWPAIRSRLPEARLHRFGAAEPAGASEEGVVDHPAPADSAEAFAPGAILLLPIRLASGVRLRLLEAWARGVPVVATAAGASGLAVEPGRQALIADDAESTAAAVAWLAAEPALGARLVAEGRERLAAEHAPARFAARFLAFADALRRPA